MTTTIYLAGPVAEAENGGSQWRERLPRECGESATFLDPLNQFNVPVDDLTVVEGDSGDDPNLVSVSELVETDKALLDRADAILVGYSHVKQIGTPMEVMCGFESDKPIAIWIRDNTDIDDLSPWYRYHASAVTNSKRLAVTHLRRHAGGGDDE